MADIGSTLREARTRARIDISEVEARTKIRAKYLRAIENEEWDLLPGPVYAKSFLRTYADFLGVDSRALLDEYKRRYERPSDHDARPIASLHRERERAFRGPLVPPWVLIGLVLVAVVVALFIVGRLGNKTPHHPVVSKPRPHPLLVHPRPRHRHRAPPPKPNTVTVQLTPTGTVYVCMVDGHGKVLIPGRIFSPGEAVPAETSAKLLLTLGNDGVRMKVNGKAVPVLPSATSIGFTLTPGGAKPLPPAGQPRCA